jgi:hypothetical protein
MPQRRVLVRSNEAKCRTLMHIVRTTCFIVERGGLDLSLTLRDLGIQTEEIFRITGHTFRPKHITFLCMTYETIHFEDTELCALNQGCQMVYFQTKSPNLSIFWRALECKMLLNFITIWNILQPFGKIYGRSV